jgi:hypothetical protein
VLVVERVDQLHCILQIVKAMPLVMFPSSSSIAGLGSAVGGCPNIATLVSVAKIPPAGVKAPYMIDWKAAAK